MTLSWVIGSGGLLGSALVRTLQANKDPVYVPTESFAWSDGARLQGQLSSALATFAALARAAGLWEIHWAAGVGTMGSSAPELATETSAWNHLLKLIARNDVLGAMPGRIALSSSAGAIYAGLQVDVINEACFEAPTTPYAQAKLEQERLLRDFAGLGLSVVALSARISTLYGPGQAYGKRQGLIAHMARSIVRNRPIQIFVPFDTVRDYITADDAAALMVQALRCGQEPGMTMRIVASERPTSIAEIVATFRRVARRPPLIATSASKLSALYLRRVQFRSSLPLPRATPQTGLPIGVAQVLAAERLAFARG
jgi:UDP-glucose 4-epimerase